MIVTIAKIFSVLLAAMVISRSITDLRAKKESVQMASFWIVVWLAIVALALFPTIIDYFINALGGNRTGLGTIIGMAIVFVLFISYRVYIKAHRIEKQVAEIAKEIALDKCTPEKLNKK